MSASLLELIQVSKHFGGLKAIDEVSLTLQSGKLYGLIGPNGAGKTTLFNVLTGIYEPTRGQILFEGQHIERLKANQVARLGVARTFQNIRLFKDMSVLENVLVGSASLAQASLVSTVFHSEGYRQEVASRRAEALELLRFFGLGEKADWGATALPYGEQRKLEMARALASKPKLLCLDEPAAGMNHNETEKLMEMIHRIRSEFRMTILLIEHDMKLVMGVCDHIFVLDHGGKIAEGSPAQIQKNPKVIEAYLGVDEDDSSKDSPTEVRE